MLNSSWSSRLFDLGAEYSNQGKLKSALRCFQAACVADNQNPCAWQELALLQLKAHHPTQAWQSIRRALSLNGNSPRSLSISALVAADLGNFNQSIAFIENAQKQTPNDINLDLIKADILRLAGDFAGAELLLVKAMENGVDPIDIELQRCELFQTLNRLDDLKFSLNKLIAKQPNLPRIHLTLAELQLGQKDFASGWTNYEGRLDISEYSILRKYPWPYWKGEILKNKTILVYGEQGIGDEIMFASCLPDLLKLARRVIFVCEDRLTPLFAHSFEALEILSFENAWEIATNKDQSVDYCIAIGSLPLHFRRSVTQFPTHKGYLIAEEAWIQPWREKLKTLANDLKVGIAWQGGLMRTGLRTRSLEPEQLQSLLELPGIQFINIQHGKVRRELQWLTEKRHLPVTTWPLDTKNISELAGLVSEMDLIITPCCSLVHLAGALGKPTWVMTPKVASWRYLNEGETMPWYPSVRLFRQPESGDWASVIDKIREQLLNGSAKITAKSELFHNAYT
jgi:tetratricopeptide (TPR) repeat protein